MHVRRSIFASTGRGEFGESVTAATEDGLSTGLCSCRGRRHGGGTFLVALQQRGACSPKQPGYRSEDTGTGSARVYDSVNRLNKYILTSLFHAKG